MWSSRISVSPSSTSPTPRSPVRPAGRTAPSRTWLPSNCSASASMPAPISTRRRPCCANASRAARRIRRRHRNPCSPGRSSGDHRSSPGRSATCSDPPCRPTAWAVNALTLDELDIMPPGGPPPKFEALGSTKQILDVFDRNAKAARAALVKTPDAEFKKPWAFKVAGRTVDTSPKYTVYRRTVLNHLAHHRGQLTVYLRLNDAPVPAVYGPTADEPNF